MDRDTLTQHMHRAGNQWAICCRMGDYTQALELADEIEAYARAIDRLDNPWDAMKGSPDTSRLGRG